jgi:hypothetical protein
MRSREIAPLCPSGHQAQAFRASAVGVTVCGDGCRRHEDGNQVRILRACASRARCGWMYLCLFSLLHAVLLAPFSPSLHILLAPHIFAPSTCAHSVSNTRFCTCSTRSALSKQSSSPSRARWRRSRKSSARQASASSSSTMHFECGSFSRACARSRRAEPARQMLWVARQVAAGETPESRSAACARVLRMRIFFKYLDGRRRPCVHHHSALIETNSDLFSLLAFLYRTVLVQYLPACGRSEPDDFSMFDVDFRFSLHPSVYPCP